RCSFLLGAARSHNVAKNQRSLGLGFLTKVTYVQASALRSGPNLYNIKQSRYSLNC
ncbi:hypothetical protein HMPREF9104_02073, partial [Lentilactobacillus kisonensis F0435]